MQRHYNSTESTRNFLTELSNHDLLPASHRAYLGFLKSQGVNPKVIYDIGACVMHWTRKAREQWPDASYYLFDANRCVDFILKDENHYIGVLSNEKKSVIFYDNVANLGGNSYYRENPAVNPAALFLFPPESGSQRLARRLDEVVTEKGFPSPDFMKLDVQGAELDILMGAGDLLKTVEHLILEIPKAEYNIGAPSAETTIGALSDLGFRLETKFFSESTFDGDCHFVRR